MKKDRAMYKKVPAMSPTIVHDYLREVGRAWRGQGVAIELGSWLGATAMPLLEGLVEVGYNRPFYAYDRWAANKAEVKKAAIGGVHLHKKQNLLPICKSNLSQIYGNLRMYRGQIPAILENYPGDPIEICLFDAPKNNPTFSTAIERLSPYWIPGVTVLGLLDYYFYTTRSEEVRYRFLAPVTFIESHPNSFTKLAEWPGQTSSVFFRYEKKL